MTVPSIQNNGNVINEGASQYKVLPLGNFAGGGSIGTAATTVDIYSAINIAQTTAGQTLTLSSPTVTSYLTPVYITNNGTTAFTLLGSSFAAGQTGIAYYNGTSFNLTSAPSLGGASMSIGGTVTGGTASRVLFEGAGPVLADDANLTWDSTNKLLTLGTGGATITGKPFAFFAGVGAGNPTVQSGVQTVAIGRNAGGALTTANSNTLIGDGAGQVITAGTRNTAVGDGALRVGVGVGTPPNTSFQHNVALGRKPDSDVITDGSFNILIGPVLGGLSNEDSQLCIGGIIRGTVNSSGMTGGPYSGFTHRGLTAGSVIISNSTQTGATLFHVQESNGATTGIQTWENSTGKYRNFINTGTPSGVVTPSEIGDLCNDVTNGDLYIANGVTNTSWNKLTNTSTAWDTNGNTVGSQKTLGTIDAFALPIITTNTTRFTVAAGSATFTGNGNTLYDTVGGTGTINIGGTNQSAGIIIGQSTTSADIVSIGAGTQTSNILLGQNSASVIKLGTSNNAQASTITIGNTNNGTGITEKVGLAGYVLDGQATSTYTIGASTTTGTITVGGAAQTGLTKIVGPQASSVVLITGVGTVAGTTRYEMCNGTFTRTFPASTGTGRIISIKNAGTGTVTVAFNGAEHCDSGSSFDSTTVALTSDVSQDFMDVATYAAATPNTGWQRI